ncbi:Sedoheptulokinase [Phytophthora nicotianae]|uniref:Sedoheptulokinase n=1 Tax=Phytophthora nicotianae TaxID=4792 RepID=A0A0W8CB43_PHYNI|nr:Sedoheptulokinase [Phytophthora nicotianae]
MATRRSYTAAFKLSVVRELTENSPSPSVRSLAQRHGVTPSMIRKWLSNQSELEAAVALETSGRKLGSGRRPNTAIDSALLHFKKRNKLSIGTGNKKQKTKPTGVTVQVSQEAETIERDCMFGMDIGLKNIKCALVCATSGNILATSSAPIQHDTKSLESEQNVTNILFAVLSAVQALPPSLRGNIRSIGICGVMHGIVWWHCDAVRQAVSEIQAGNGTTRSWPWSTYITFLDQRCTPAMLTEWRAKIQLANAAATATPFGIEPFDVCVSTSPIASGYGLATFAYMMERQPSDIAGYDACGTIQDFIAFALCGHSFPAQNCMDVTDAFSWGGFDINTRTWNPHAVQALNLPAHMLPTVKAPGAIIGQSSEVAAVLCLPIGKPVYLAMGDHPCAVMTAMAQTRGPADLNLSRTSGTYSECQAWSRQLAVNPTVEYLSDDAMYARLISLGGTKLDTDLKFSPTLYGEWASPDVRGSIEQLRISNWSLGDISASICRGLVDNIFSMVPDDLRTDLLQQPMIGTGNALVRNSLLRHFLGQKLAHPSQLSIQSTADAAVGVAYIPSLLQK